MTVHLLPTPAGLPRLIEHCEKCKGDQTIQHPLWVSYFKEEAQARKAGTITAPHDDEFYVNWWQQYGRDANATMASGGPPPEDIPCDDCDGSGVRLTPEGTYVQQALYLASQTVT